VSGSESQVITQKSASNLALAFVMLPRERREAMVRLYAFCREVDDVADEDTVPVEERRRSLAEWREDVKRVCEGGEGVMPVNRELAEVVRRYGLPFGLFDELLMGVEADLDILRYETYDEVEEYCYRVASVVGLLSIEIFGYVDSGCREYAVSLGRALQWTNILRDVGNDAKRGRIYLPREAMMRHGVTEEEIFAGQYSDRFLALAREIGERARGYYGEARRLLPEGDRRRMVAAELMGSVYWRLLSRLERSGYAVLGEKPQGLSKVHKVWLILRSWVGCCLGGRRSAYGRVDG
jgi:phytoene synthase